MSVQVDPGPPAGLPPAEIAVGPRVVRELLRSQHPDLARLPIRHAATGWDNNTFRLGRDLAVRLPRRRVGVPLILKEQRLLPTLANRLPIAVPVPLRFGVPAAAFPWPWSVVRWIAGRSVEHKDLPAGEAAAFGRFLASLHQPAPPGAPRNPYRGVRLVARSSQVEPRLDRFAASATGLAVPVGTARTRWRQACAAPAGTARVWIHGDLHPKNVVARAGKLAAVLDWGDMAGGDPATDLAAAWMLFPTHAHGDIWDSYGGVAAPMMARAVGWAVFFGVTLLDCGLAGDPLFARIGRRTLQRVCVET